jgi:YHS domain-containing protein
MPRFTTACLMLFAMTGFGAGNLLAGEDGHAHQTQAAHEQTGHVDMSESTTRLGDAYPLLIDPVTGEPLKEVEEPIAVLHQGRELHFAAPASAERFSADPETYSAKVKKLIIEQQKPLYPLATCVVSGERLGEMGEPVDHVYGNRLVRFCCKGCISSFEKNPTKYLATIDKAVIKTQETNYPLDTCVVSGEKLGQMGEPFDFVIGNRLVRLCCKGCVKSLEKNPAAYLTKLDAAVVESQKPGYPLDTCVVTGEKLGSMGEPFDYVYGDRLVRLCCHGCLKTFREDPSKYLAKLNGRAKDDGGVHDEHERQAGHGKHHDDQ